MNTVFTKTYKPQPVNVGEVLRYAGVKGDLLQLEPILDSCIREAEKVLTYRVCYGEYSIYLEDNRIIADFMQIESVDLRKNLTNCDSVVLFGATLGIGFDRLLTGYSSISPTKAVLLQAIGAERIESLCDTFCNELMKEKLKDGRALKPRFSPGYGDLPLSIQHTIFNVLDCPKRIGLTLNESLIMSPSKSVTAFVGISKPNRE